MLRVAIPWKLFLISTFLVVFSCAGMAQQRSRIRTTQPDAVNAIQFSPDARVLAIAWGADENRVELWDTRTGNLLRAIRGFDGPVWSASFSPDGRTLVTASGGSHPEKIAQKAKRRTSGDWFTEIKWWDWRAGELIKRLELSDDETINLIASYSPDGRVLAMVENRISTGVTLGDYVGPWVTWAEVLRQGMVSYSAGFFDSRLSLIDARTGESNFRLKGGYNSVRVPLFSNYRYGPALWMGRRLTPMIFSPDGRVVATWKTSEVRLWNTTTGTEIAKFSKFKGRLISISFSPDGHLIAGALEKVSVKDYQTEFKSEIIIWEAATGLTKQVMAVHTHAVSNLVFANERQLLIGGLQFAGNRSFASMELVDLQTGSVGKIISNEAGDVSSIALASDGQSLAFQTNGETVKLLTTNGWRTMYTFSAGEEKKISSSSLSRFLVTVKSIPAVAFAANGKAVIGETEEAGFKLWDARTGELKKTLAADATTGAVAAISRDGSRAADIATGTVRVWDVETGSSQSVPANEPTAISLSGDGGTLAVAEAGHIKILNTGPLKTGAVISGVESPISFIVLSSHGKNVAAAAGGSVKIWDTASGTLKQTIPVGGEVSALQFARSDRIAIGRRDGAVSVYSLAGGALILELKKHTAAVNAIGFSDDGTLMATGGDDRAAIIWETGSGRALHTLKGHDLAITSLAFSPDGATLAVGTGNASVVLWHVAKGKLDRLLK
jgi:WD40 repeat protein